MVALKYATIHPLWEVGVHVPSALSAVDVTISLQPYSSVEMDLGPLLELD